jgi:serine/threonine-protein kinase
MDVEIGQLLDNKYKIVRLLGEGGMGAVYEGENVRIHHRVAIKVMHANVEADNGARERFEREAQAAGRIGSEHICEVYDLGELPNGARYMVMEFLAGETLSTRVLKLGRIPPNVMAPLLLQLLDGLEAAHSAGIIHRDLKPDNVFLQRTKSGGDFVKIVDFGVSKFNALSGGSAMSMTRTGAVVGTPYYMSPEQVRGAKLVDHRSDLYSVGVVLFESITGALPFQAETFNELMFKIALEAPADPEQLVPGLDPRFAAIIRKAMARDAPQRFDTAQQFAAAVVEWMQFAGIALPPGHPSISQSGSGLQSPLAQSSPGTSPGMPALAATPNPGANPALDKTTASGSSFSKTQTQPKKSGSGAIAAIGIGVVVLAGAGIGVMQMSKGKPAATAETKAAAVNVEAPPAAKASAPPAVAAAAPVETIAPAPAASPLAAAPAPSSAPAPSDTSAATATASHGAPVHAAVGPRPMAAPAPAAPNPAAAASANSMTLKGRTIRTEL